MKQIAPLALAVSVLAMGALIYQIQTVGELAKRIPNHETQEVRLVNPKETCLTKTWCSKECGEVVVKTCREAGETAEEFRDRHLAEIAEMMEVCPEDCDE